jgi:hypothetical protein
VTPLRAYLSNLHAHMASTGRRRNAHNLRVVIAALERLEELEQRVAMMEMEMEQDENQLRSVPVAISSVDDQSRSPPTPTV